MHPFSGIIVRYVARQTNEGDVSTSTPVDAAADELHVNLWEVGSRPFIDIGILISNRAEVNAIEVVLPWKLGAEAIMDLGTRLNSEKSIAAIFNEAVRYDGSADEPFASVSFLKDNDQQTKKSSTEQKTEFVLLRLNSTHFSVFPRLTGEGEMTILRINLSDTALSGYASISSKIYLRFRIKNVPHAIYQATFCQPDRNILSSFIETRIIDFRINVRRGIPDELLAGDSNTHFPKFKKIHFFLTINRSQECIFEGQNFVGCRSLMDEDVWNEYVRSNVNAPITTDGSVRNYLGYQWTKAIKGGGNEAGHVKDLVALGRFSRTSSSTSQIFRFIGLGLVFGMAGNGAWEIIKFKSGHFFGSWGGDDTNNVFLILLILLIAILLIFSGNIFDWFRKKALFQTLLKRTINCLSGLLK
ncbi:hypothetical protein [Collimonas pratensis]|uniref:hypothetical protein n=1 Tax=Collimonas pratensis TaxID=279113 RepID=UPI0012E6FFEC|nr:hypothetical protein [Collimonas pratensis]